MQLTSHPCVVLENVQVPDWGFEGAVRQKPSVSQEIVATFFGVMKMRSRVNLRFKKVVLSARSPAASEAYL